MSFFDFNKKKKKISLLFELRGDAVASSIIKTHIQEKPEILYSNKRTVTNREKIDPKKYAQILMKELDKLVEETYKVGILKILKVLDKNIEISDVHVVLSSPWVLSQSKNIRIKKNKGFQINREFLQNILLNEENNLSSPEIFYKKDDRRDDNILLIEEKIVQSKLNGYKVHSIFEKFVTCLELNLFLSVSNYFFIENIKKVISKTFIRKPIFFHSFVLAGFSVIRDIVPHNNDYIFVDIGAEVTDICFVNDSAIHSVYTYPFGKNNIVRKIVEKTKNTYDTVISLINMQCDNKCDERALTINEKALDESVSDWASGLYKIFTSLTSKGGIPRDIILLIDDKLANIIGKKIKTNKLKSFKMINNDFNVNFINDNKFNNLVNKNKFFEDDFTLKICTIYLDKLTQKN